jgi:hypothetical protein
MRHQIDFGLFDDLFNGLSAERRKRPSLRAMSGVSAEQALPVAVDQIFNIDVPHRIECLA